MDEEILIVEDMKKLGLSEYEARAYLKLLEQHPVNGYILSKNSGIPRSRIYEILDNLKNKQIVFEQIEGETTLYYPLDPKLLINKLRSNYEDILDNLDEYTKRVYTEGQLTGKMVIIKGRNKIIDFINLLIKNAEKRIALSIWEEEINDLSGAIDAAIKRGIMLRGIYFGKTKRYKDLATHRRLERYLDEKKERYMTVIIDENHVVSGIISRGENSQVTWTQDAGFIGLSDDFIAHDIEVNVYSDSLDKDKQKEYEAFLDNIRKDYYSFSDEEFKKFK
ncbi:sugar-specific transcriptional regulator TrmB [Oxobacter pfennigii]|uniref:Sugar-specific transcriptional regulator TrmB n=1 Tax=Oxobacter pfennigii TaxID=36849 RepID=A0A0P8X3V4_9CLOT|nr:helix-turn-helix domain-containing protein [Oxobacter pfennigii]KPU45481.1 sugar-specific transcriptional regulator TrmB [Oxobacter pfennigii]